MADNREGTAHNYGDLQTPVAGVGQDGSWKPLPLETLEADAWSTDEVNVPSAHTAAAIAFPAQGFGFANTIGSIVCSYSGSGTLSGGRLTVADGSDTVFDVDISALGTYTFQFSPPKRGHSNTAMTVTLADGGANVQGKVNASHWTDFIQLVGQTDFSDPQNSGIDMLFL